MQKMCPQCQTQFEITEQDLAFYDKISPVFNGKKFSVPAPTLCPPCRLKRRLSFRNERSLYHRKCDLTGKEIISMYSPDKPFKVYDRDAWWSDQWDAQSYGRDFDFSRGFFEQFFELYKDVPHVHLYNINVENSYYTNYALNQKNCYLIFGGGTNEDCMYGKFLSYCKNVSEGLSLYSCEFCYQGVASDSCYECKFFNYCRSCSNCMFIKDCSSCRNCLLCFGLRNKEYCYMNQYVGKEKFEEIQKQFLPLTHQKIAEAKEQLKELEKNGSTLASHLYQCEGSTGDLLIQCKSCISCFDCKESEDCKYTAFTPHGINSYDSTFTSPKGVEFSYEACSTMGSRVMGTFLVWTGADIYYSMECHSCKNCFGCVGLRNQQYCVFNKQYSREEYEVVVSKIIEQMGGELIVDRLSKVENELNVMNDKRQTINFPEWGEYFPAHLSPFAYNETIAQEYFPLTKEEAIARHLNWKEDEQTAVYQGSNFQVPESIAEVSNDICEKVLSCEISKKPYKVNQKELEFYRNMGVPVPRTAFEVRHLERLKEKGPMYLWERECSNCHSVVSTNCSPEKYAAIICEKCYMEGVY